MPGEAIFYISKFGYIAIVTLIFLQEIGLPSPVPVELLVFFTGYLSYTGAFFLPFVIITALAADLAGAGILYLVFYTSGTFLMRKKPSWLHVSEQRVKKIREKISNRGRLNIFLFRLVSMTRGYAAIISGLLHLNLRIYIPSVIMAAVTWTSFYASLGFILGPSSKRIFSDPRYFKVFLFSIVLIVISISVFVWLRNKYVNKKKETSGFNSSGI